MLARSQSSVTHLISSSTQILRQNRHLMVRLSRQNHHLLQSRLRRHIVQNLFSFLSGKTVFLESEKKQKLIKFYIENGFTILDNEILSKNKKELTQLYKIL